jgi:hypothetical protein
MPLLHQWRCRIPMRIIFPAVLVCFALVSAHAETLDRIAVTVGKHVITQSDVLLYLRVAAFVDGKAPDLSGPQARTAAERMVDLYLVLVDAAATRAPEPSASDVAALVAPMRARYPSDAEYKSALARAGITEDDLNKHLLDGLWMMRYTDLRFRPEVQISDEDLHTAFTALTSKLPAGSPAPSFEASRGRLEELVTNQRMIDALDKWLAMARTETPILYRDAAFR